MQTTTTNEKRISVTPAMWSLKVTVPGEFANSYAAIVPVPHMADEPLAIPLDRADAARIAAGEVEAELVLVLRPKPNAV